MLDDDNRKGRSSQDRLVIRPEDLGEAPRTDTDWWSPPPPTGPATVPTNAPLPAMRAAPAPVVVGGGATSGFAKLGNNAVTTGLIGGTLGGFLGALILQGVKNPDKLNASSASDLRVQSAIVVAIVGAILGFVLMAWDGFTSGLPDKGFREGFGGAVAGAIAGFIGGYIAQMLFTNILEDFEDFEDYKNKAILARVAAWGVFGTLIGAGIGIRGGQRKIVNGIIGGLVGGGLGGLVFQLISNSNDDGSTSSFQLRMLGFAATGLGIGLGVGVVERARRESWITIASGPMTGKEFILYNDRTIVGADHHCNIVLVRDPAVIAQHVSFDRTAGGVVVTSLGGAVTVNGVQVPSAKLNGGDRVGIGASILSYQERALAATANTGGNQW